MTPEQEQDDVKKVSITFWLDPRDKAEFSRLSDRHGGMTAVLIRMLLEFNENERIKAEKRND